MIERVARAIAAEEDDPLAGDGVFKLYLRHAQAATFALRIPTAAALEAGSKAMGPMPISTHEQRLAALAVGYTAMIDAALEE